MIKMHNTSIGNKHFKKNSLSDIGILFIIITFVGFALSYSLSTPTYEGPDEETHHYYSIRESNLISSFPYSLIQTNSLYNFVMGGISNFFSQPEHNISVNYGYPFDYKGRYHHGTDDIFPYAGLALEVHILRMFSIISGVITIIFTYKISQIIFANNRSLTLYSTAIVSLTPTFIWINSVMNTDVFVWMFSTIAIFFLLVFLKEKFKTKYIILTAIFTGLAILSKSNGYFIYIAVFAVLIYLISTKQISIKNFLKNSIIFLSISIISGAYYLPYQMINSFYKKYILSLDTTELPIIIPSHMSPGLNYVNEHLLNFNFLHTRLIEFSLSGMGQNVVWLPKIFYHVADIFILFSLIGIIFVIIKKKYKQFGIEKNYLIVLLTPLFVISIMFYNWISSEVGVARYTFPIISIFGVVFTIGFFAFTKQKNLKLLLLIPILFLGIVNIANILTIQSTLAFGTEDTDGDGISNELDLESFRYSNHFSDKQLGGNTSGEIIRIIPQNITDHDPLKQEILRQIKGWSPDYEHLLDLIPLELYSSPNTRNIELRNVLTDLEKEGKIFSHGDAWTLATHKIWMEKEENGIRLRNDFSNPVQIDTCNDKFLLNYTDEIIFSCNDKLKIIHPKYEPLPVGINDGDLIQGKNQPEVYLIKNGKKHHVRTIETFEKLGFTIDMIKFVPKELLDKIPKGPPI